MPPASRGGSGGGGVKFPSIVKHGAHQGAGEQHAAARRKGGAHKEEKGLVLDGKLLVQKEQAIRFSPCSPGQIIEMCKFLGVDSDREFYLLAVVRRAVVAPFPEDWAVGVDRLGNTYYYNKYTMRVINSHPLSELFIDWIAASRQRLADETELRRKDALEDEEIEEDMGTPWMRFGTQDEDTYYWFNFKNRKLYTDPQYKHILHLELEERAAQAEEQQKDDPRKKEEEEHRLRLKKATEKFFASGLRKFWLRWQLHMMELRNQQAKALVKSGMVSGRMEAKGFRQWKEKAEQLGFVRRVMAPLGGRRDKQITRDFFNSWKEFIDEVLGEKKQQEVVKEYFRVWKSSCAKSVQLKRVKEVIRAMILGNSYKVNFEVWKEIWQTNKDKEVKVLTEACIKIQRQHRAKLKRKSANRAAVNVRKQIKYRLLRVCETQQTTLDMNESTDQAPPVESSGAEAGSLAVFLLEGAMEKAKDEAEKARLRQVVRIAKSKSTVLPDEPGYGTESVRDEIYRIVDILDPIDRVKLRPKIESIQVAKHEAGDMDSESDEEEEDAAGGGEEGQEDVLPGRAVVKKPSLGPGKLAELGSALDDLVSKIASATTAPDKVQEQAELDAYEKDALAQPAGTRLHQMAEKAKGFIDRALRPEEKSQALHNKFIVDERITVLDELDSAMELFLNAVDKKRSDDQTW